ncbi:MAG: alpha/beta fold hydrolase [SAR202 cluster bacterium]|nr:alpha/beta fold hydrolase [SAR202 cluster bacterium]
MCSMEKIRRQGKGLLYVSMLPEDYDPDRSYPLVVLLHGFGSNMHDLASLAPALDGKDFAYVCPNAPLSIPLGPNMKGFAWAPLPGERTEEHLKAAEKLIAEFLDEASKEYKTPKGKILLGGFSQGGMMTFRVGLSAPDKLAGLFSLSGFIDNPDAVKASLPSQRDQPIFIAHGTEDTVIPVGGARKSAAFLREQGYNPEYHEYVMAHQVTPQVIDDLRVWMHRTLQPSG